MLRLQSECNPTEHSGTCFWRHTHRTERHQYGVWLFWCDSCVVFLLFSLFFRFINYSPVITPDSSLRTDGQERPVSNVHLEWTLCRWGMCEAKVDWQPHRTRCHGLKQTEPMREHENVAQLGVSTHLKCTKIHPLCHPVDAHSEICFPQCLDLGSFPFS